MIPTKNRGELNRFTACSGYSVDRLTVDKGSDLTALWFIGVAKINFKY
jgi:hypothetical protein